MVAQTKAAVRPGAQKAAAVELKGLNDQELAAAKEAQLDQTAAAAVVEAGELPADVEIVAGGDAEIAADVLAASGVMPTDAPAADAGIGLLAQAAPAPATDAQTTAAAPAPTEAPAEAAPVNPWVVGGAAVLGVAAIAALASDDDDSPTPTPPPPPLPVDPPVEPPAPPANVAPVVTTPQTVEVANNAEAANVGSGLAAAYTDETAMQGITIGTITVAADAGLELNATNGHYYQMVTTAASWEDAAAAAELAGGRLVVINDVAEAQFLHDTFDLGTNILGSDATWVGASQDVPSPIPAGMLAGEGWSWLDGREIGADDALWNNYDYPQDGSGVGAIPSDGTGNVGALEGGAANFAAIFEGAPSAPATEMMFDLDGAALRQYIIEFDSALTLNGNAVTTGTTLTAAEAAQLTWNSMFNSGGSFSYTASDGSLSSNLATVNITESAPVSIGSLIEDPNLFA